MSSRYTTTTPSVIKSLKMSSIMVWNVAGLLHSLKNITNGLKSPRFVRNATFHSCPSFILLGDAPLCPMFPLIFLCHLCTFLLIITSPRRSALVAPIPESDGHVMQHSHHLFTILHVFLSFYYLSSFYYFDSDFWYIDMHPTLTGFYPFLLGSPARCAFQSYFMFIYICLGSPARS